MKKIIAILLALCALTALTVSAFAASSPEPEAAEDTAVAAAQEETEITAKLSEDDALAAALKDAGEKEADVEVTKNKLSERSTEDDETIPVYTVKFSTDTTEYKYYIDGNTGAVIYKSVEFQNPDIVLKSRGRSESDKASGDMDASDEMSEDGETITGSTRDRRDGSHKTASAESDASDVLTDTTGA